MLSRVFSLLHVINILIYFVPFQLSQGDSDRTTPEKEFMYVGSADSDRKKLVVFLHH